MNDTELTIVVMAFALLIMGLGSWVALRGEGTEETLVPSNAKTDEEFERYRKKGADIVGKIMVGLTLVFVLRAISKGIDKLSADNSNFNLTLNADIFIIIGFILAWIIVMILLLRYANSPKKAKKKKKKKS